jgi:hypothetical protein
MKGVKREIPYAEAIPFLGMENIVKEFKKAVFAVQTQKDGWRPLGSGFLINGKNNDVLGITCHHVVSDAIKENTPIFIGLDIKEGGYHRFQCKILYEDHNHDVAVIRPFKAVIEPVKDEAPIPIVQNLYFPEEAFDDNSSLVEGRGVIILGYPLSLGIEDDKNHPVVRFGIIAQYTGKDVFLIDGIASHGSSGSPVFAIKHNDHKLVGMITSHIPDNIVMFDENRKLSAMFPYNSGLARAIKMPIIKAAIEKAQPSP